MTLIERWNNAPNRLKKWFALAAACCATIIGVNNAWPIIDPYFPAHKAYVEHEIKKASSPIISGLSSVQISMAKGRQNTIKDRLLSLEIDLSKAIDPEDKVRKQFQIRELQNEYVELDTEIKSLKFNRDKN